MTKDPGYDRRKYPRVSTESVLSVARVDSSDLLGWSLDLSQGGIRFQWVGLEVEVGELLRVTLDLGGRQASAVGKVVRVVSLDALAREVALAFVEVEAGTLEVLQDHLHEAGESCAAVPLDAPRGEGASPLPPGSARGSGAGRAGRLGRPSPLLQQALERGKGAVRALGRRAALQLDRLPIASRRRVAALDRRLAALARRVDMLQGRRTRT